ncbi:hypothetical protein [Lacinutrix sp. MedPE-SW]|uniref:hypothetical protein n=1 Tax=Lacinutrix sp. MedPE-SW TaxID=1860087 RepID=UPI0025B96B61|nr:hypothetical protein [Lacinutrix sp. MedPE-SW]
MKIYLLTFFLFCSIIGVNAQIDSENRSIAIPAENVDDPLEDDEIIIQPVKKNDEKPEKEDDIKETLSKEEQMSISKRKEFSMVHDDKLRGSAELYGKQLKNALQLREDEYREEGRKVNQFFGKYLTKSKYQDVLLRDFGAEDGDLVRIWVNGTIVNSRIVLSNANKNFTLTLQPGENVVEFEALNQGTSGPNTAGFAVFEKTTGNKLLSSQWNLLTGVRGTFTVVLLPPNSEDEKNKE